MAWLCVWRLTSLSTIFQLYQSWKSVLLVEETKLHKENHRPVARPTDKLYHIILYRVHLASNSQH